MAQDLARGRAAAAPCGLYFAGQIGEVIPTDPHFGFAVVGSLTSIVAAEVRVSGFRFFLAVEPVSIGAANAALRLEDHRLFSCVSRPATGRSSFYSVGRRTPAGTETAN
jgi:hypothetical protein